MKHPERIADAGNSSNRMLVTIVSQIVRVCGRRRSCFPASPISEGVLAFWRGSNQKLVPISEGVLAFRRGFN